MSDLGDDPDGDLDGYDGYIGPPLPAGQSGPGVPSPGVSDPRPEATARYVIVGEWLAQDVGTCMCADARGYGGHEYYCGLEPIQTVPSLLAAARAVQRVEALIAHVARTTAHEALETSSPAYFLAMSQFADQVRAALGTEQEGQR